MKRREFLNKAGNGVAALALPSALASLAFSATAMAQSDRPKITDIVVHRMKTLGEARMMESAWAPGRPYMRRIGGGTITEIITDQGISGIAPGLNPANINRMKNLLVGQDPFDNERLDGGFYRADLKSSASQGSALLVFYSSEIETTQAEVEAAGGNVIQAIFNFPGGRRFHFTEPSGNEFAVWTDL